MNDYIKFPRTFQDLLAHLSETLLQTFALKTLTKQSKHHGWVNPKMIWRIIKEPWVLVHAKVSAAQITDGAVVSLLTFLGCWISNNEILIFLQGVKESKQGLRAAGVGARRRHGQTRTMWWEHHHACCWKKPEWPWQWML